MKWYLSPAFLHGAFLDTAVKVTKGGYLAWAYK